MRVLVVDDVASARRVIRDALEEDPEITVVGEAADGAEAVALAARLLPDVITMDVLMPVLDGYAATLRIMARRPTPIVAVTSLSLQDGTVLSRMLAAGAVDVMSKAFSREPRKWDRMRRELVTRVKAAAQARITAPGAANGSAEERQETADCRLLIADRASAGCGLRSADSAGRSAGVSPAGVPSDLRIADCGPRMGIPGIVVVAASTGGPTTLCRLLQSLHPGLAVPILVVQHISEGFADWLAGWLSGASGLTVGTARDSERALPGRVYLAPDDHHLLIQSGGVIRLNRALPVHSVRPSADVLFRSAAQAFGAGVIGVVLTGMGEDGTEGARCIKDAGGIILAQDEESCAIFGMPRAVIGAGLADDVLPPEKIAWRLRRLCGREETP